MSDIYQDKKINYSRFLSALFSSIAILGLSFLCLLNNLSIDLYSAIYLFKTVIPGGISFWILGYVIGKKLDGLNTEIITVQKVSEKQAYEIPSMFSMQAEQNESGGMPDMKDVDV